MFESGDRYQPNRALFSEGDRLVAGYGTALTVAAGLLIAAGILAAVTLPSKQAAQADDKPAVAEVDQTSH